MKPERFLQLADTIEQNPGHFDMNSWLSGEGIREEMDGPSIAQALIVAPRCSTTGCIAGLTVALHPDEVKTPVETIKWNFVDAFAIEQYQSHIINAARKILDITAKQAEQLFFSENWPDEYQVDFEYAESDKGRATVAARLLRDIVEHGFAAVWDEED